MGIEIVVLTGAAGCIGFHTLRLLIERDEKIQEIRCLDLREPQSGMENEIGRLLKSKPKSQISVTWTKGDIRDINLVESVLDGADCVIHCAAKIEAWTEIHEQDLDELRSVNVEGTETLLKTARRLGVHKFIHVSSFEIYASLDTIYYATESTLPETKSLLFGASGHTKKEAEEKVRQYSNVKLGRPTREGKDQFLAVIIRFSTVYGEFDRHYVSKIIELTDFFGGRLKRLSNIWIRQQSIYATNAAWALIKAKQRLDVDTSISGEEFHITDDTPIDDPFDFLEPFLKTRGMEVTKTSYPFVLIWILVYLFFAGKRLIKLIDVFGLFTSRKSRYQETLEREQDSGKRRSASPSGGPAKRRRWFDFVMPQTLAYMCGSSFLNRTKASLRLDYEPLISAEESVSRSLEWYREAKI